MGKTQNTYLQSIQQFRLFRLWSVGRVALQRCDSQRTISIAVLILFGHLREYLQQQQKLLVFFFLAPNSITT